MKMIIDATDSVMGRIAAVAAKKALLGESINIVNCENAIVTGRKVRVLADFKQKLDRGIPLKGPYFPKQSDRIFRRAIRGMLPYKKERGKEAFKRIMCHIGVPDKFSSQKLELIGDASVSKLPNVKYVYLKDIAKHLGGKL
ncbi:50S ribosomal protein L13 [Candidatus Woesearchaeota archaeon]|nr:50S ribosomal protein L13 [Candidatus Woesearchaeota archaeon]